MSYLLGKIKDDGEVSWQEIADELGLSRQGAKYVYDGAIRKLQNNKKLKEYWYGLVREEVGNHAASRIFDRHGISR